MPRPLITLGKDTVPTVQEALKLVVVTYLQSEIPSNYKDTVRHCIHTAYRVKIAANLYPEQLHTLIISQH
jgi:hypothetical protein